MKLEDAIKTSKFNNAKHKATLNLMYSVYWLKTHMNSTLKTFDITAEQYNVLRILRGKHPDSQCVKEIGSRMLEKSSNVPRIIDRLVAKKLAKRSTSKEDKRETLISITEKGLTLLEEATKVADKQSEEIFGLTNEEAETLNALLEKMRKTD